MSKIVKIFNELIKIKLSPQFGENLLDCKLIYRKGGIGEHHYDLLFIFDREYNNPAIQLESVLQTCDELFNWVDLTMLTNLDIIVMNKWGRNQHYSYFELMDTLCGNDSYYHLHRLTKHPKYHEYREWRSNKEREERVKRAWEMEMTRTTRNDLIQQTRMVKSRKSKFFNWW
jgi:hypothetical protein